MRRAESRTPDEGAVIGAVAHVETAQEIVVADTGTDAHFLVGLHVLDVGLDQRMHMLHLGDEEVFALDNAVDDLIEGGGRRWAGGRR